MHQPDRTTLDDVPAPCATPPFPAPTGSSRARSAPPAPAAPFPNSSSQYHRGRNPTLSSPASTSSTPAPSSNAMSTPVRGVNLTRHARARALPAVSASPPERAPALPRTHDRNSSPHWRHTCASQAPGLPRIIRGSCIVLNDCTVVTWPLGVRNPTTISYASPARRVRISPSRVNKASVINSPARPEETIGSRT